MRGRGSPQDCDRSPAPRAPLRTRAGAARYAGRPWALGPGPWAPPLPSPLLLTAHCLLLTAHFFRRFLPGESTSAVARILAGTNRSQMLIQKALTTKKPSKKSRKKSQKVNESRRKSKEVGSKSPEVGSKSPDPRETAADWGRWGLGDGGPQIAPSPLLLTAHCLLLTSSGHPRVWPRRPPESAQLPQQQPLTQKSRPVFLENSPKHSHKSQKHSKTLQNTQKLSRKVQHPSAPINSLPSNNLRSISPPFLLLTAHCLLLTSSDHFFAGLNGHSYAQTPGTTSATGSSDQTPGTNAGRRRGRTAGACGGRSGRDGR